MTRLALAIVLLGISAPAFADHFGMPHEGLLEPGKAFSLSARVIDADTLEVRWDIAEGYYMHRDRLRLESLDDAVSLSAPVLPKGLKMPALGAAEVYTKEVAARLAIASRPSGPTSARIRVTTLLCNEPLGVCFAPMSRELSVDLPSRLAAGAATTGERSTGLQQLSELIAEPGGTQEFLSPEQAFVLRVGPDSDQGLLADFLIADGYYLYRDRIRFELRAADGAPVDLARLAPYELPPGKTKVDPYFGESTVYYQQASVRLGLTAATRENTDAVLQATYQGCADQGLCYPPVSKRFGLRIDGGAVMVVALEADPGMLAAPAASPLWQAVAVGGAGSEPQAAATGTALWVALALVGTALVLALMIWVLRRRRSARA